MPNGYSIIDVSDWDVDRSEPMGSKEKEWRIHPQEHERWLFKLNRMIDRAAGLHAGEDWSEKIAAEIAGLLGIPHAVVELAERDGTRDIISKDFVKDRRRYRLTHGNELLTMEVPQYPRDQKRRLSLHTVANVMDVLAADFITIPKADVPGGLDTPQEVFIGYLMLDAVIANTDRHHENWAIVERQTGPSEPAAAQLAPTFDHASSLGRELRDTAREEGLAGARASLAPTAYASKARSAFYRDQTDRRPVSPVEAFQLAAALRPQAARLWLGRLDRCTSAALGAVIGRVPELRMSPTTRQFTLRVLELNREALTRSLG